VSSLWDELLRWMVELPQWILALVLALAAGLENVVPLIPADTVVLFGGFLAGRGGTSLWLAFLATWGGNVAGALLVYAVGRRYGSRFFATRWGSFLLRPRQLEELEKLYQRHGFKVLFFSRFLPVFRSLVPVFAGTSGLGVIRTAVPVAAASAFWYGAVVYAGATAGRNWDALRAGIESAGRWLLIPGALLAAALAWWWLRTRREAG
jgi:membrane protein DedA with SNARE-associated domain